MVKSSQGSAEAKAIRKYRFKGNFIPRDVENGIHDGTGNRRGLQYVSQGI